MKFLTSTFPFIFLAVMYLFGFFSILGVVFNKYPLRNRPKEKVELVLTREEKGFILKYFSISFIAFLIYTSIGWIKDYDSNKMQDWLRFLVVLSMVVGAGCFLKVIFYLRTIIYLFLRNRYPPDEF